MATAAGTDQGVTSDVESAASPKDTSSANRPGAGQAMENVDKTLEPRVDPDAQTTVTDFLDFTEYLPSDVIRSLTLIGKLDEAYTDASLKVDELTTTWGQLPSLTAEERPSPIHLRAGISERLGQAVSSRVFAHDEAVRMSENVNRHYNRAKVLLAKLQNMMDNYPTDDPKSPVAPRSPQAVRAKPAVGEDGQKIRHHRVPKVTVPGEVLAPYEIEYDTGSDDSDISTDEDSDIYGTGRRTPAPPRIKLISNKSHKPNSRLARPVTYSSAAMTAAAAANAAALMNPPPENAVIGSADAPWLQLTNYELAKLRKRMKKNATWTPSETMVARELKALGRGPDEYRDARKKAEDEGQEFNPKVPTLVVDDESGVQHLPAGAISADSIGTEEVPTSNRGMKLNEAKKLKREALAKQAAEEAEESARKMSQAAKFFIGNEKSKSKDSKDVKDSQEPKEPKEPKETKETKETKEPAEVSQSPEKPKANPRSNGKRKREGDSGPEPSESTETTPPRPQPKRSKMETPVPPPQHPGMSQKNAPTADSNGNNNHNNNNASSNKNSNTIQPMTPGNGAQSQTPVPIPVPPQSSSRSALSPTPNSTGSNNVTTTTTIPVKPPAQTPVPLPRTDRRKSITPVAPPSRDSVKRETRGEVAKRTHHQSPPDHSSLRPPSRGQTPISTPGTDNPATRRPGSRGKAASQEPPSLAADRPRRASTARNTPIPEFKQPAKRTKRPAPGVVSTTNSGGSSAVGKRKAAPRKKARATKKEKGQVLETEMEEVDDEGNPIDPDEPRYCLCNNVSFGTMIQCDNIDNCKQEWFHLECVGLEDIPARTTKWYCPDCRKLLNIGEKGEVSARGVRK